MAKTDFSGKDILSLDQFSSQDIQHLFYIVQKMKRLADNTRPSRILAGKIIALLFFEPSSRTFSSFAAAAQRLGAGIIPIQNPETVSSVAKGETLEDTIKTLSCYAETIIMRSPVVGYAKRAADATTTPIVNAGDGIGEHPTQALLDMYTIHEHTKRLDKLTGLLVGDMLNGRTVHSLIRGLSLYKGNTLYLLSPKNLRLEKELFSLFKTRGITLIEIENEKEIPQKCDFWYWTRVQKERFSSLEEYEKVKHAFILTPDLIKKHAGKQTIFMHPLPRVGEIDTAVDTDPRAVYLTEEMRNGMYVRMALLTLIMGGKV